MARPSRPIAVRAIRFTAIFLVLIAAFVLLMTAAYALPQQRIMANLRASVPVLQAEGVYPSILAGSDSFRLDNITDALMMDTAIVTTPGGPLVSAMGDYNGVVPSTAVDARILSLRLSAEGKRPEAMAYAHYWHGYQVLLRPALTLLTYPAIRWVNGGILGLLLVALAFSLRRHAGWPATLAFLIALALTGFFIVPLSLQFSSVTYLMILATMGVLRSADRESFGEVDVEIFFVTGMLTAFFDLLTAPLLTLGMPLGVALLMLGRRDRERTLRADTLLAVKLAVAWAVGYVASIAAKAVIASVVLKTNVIAETTATVADRAGLTSGRSIVAEALLRNLLALFPFVRLQTGASGLGRVASSLPAVGLVAVVVAVLIGVVLVYRKPAADVRLAAHVLLVAPLPYLWFLAASEHSAVHYWFTYRIQAIALFAVFYTLLASLDVRRIASRVRRER